MKNKKVRGVAGKCLQWRNIALHKTVTDGYTGYTFIITRKQLDKSKNYFVDEFSNF